MTVAFAVNCVIVFVCSAIVIPIVLGVQRNKKMILSIFFDLYQHEIKNTYVKCLHFIVRMETKFKQRGPSPNSF